MKPALIAVDVDGTIAGADHVLSERTRATLGRLDSEGIRGVIITGRIESSAVDIARSVGFTAPAISCNGAMITDPRSGRRLWSKGMDPGEAALAVGTAHACGCAPTVWTDDAWYVDRPSESSDLLEVLLGFPAVVRPLADVIATEPVVKVMIGGSTELLDRHAAKIGGCLPSMVRTMDRFFEAGPAGIGKREALRFVLAGLDVPAEQAWGFGDSDGDIGWMSLLGRAVAPANAFPGVLAIADVVIGHHAEDGVADYLERELRLKPSDAPPDRGSVSRIA